LCSLSFSLSLSLSISLSLSLSLSLSHTHTHTHTHTQNPAVSPPILIVRLLCTNHITSLLQCTSQTLSFLKERQPLVCLAFVSVVFSLWQISETNNLKRGNIYFGSWFRGFSPWSAGSIPLGLRQAEHDGGQGVTKKQCCPCDNWEAEGQTGRG
jgi:hypothetical protein